MNIVEFIKAHQLNIMLFMSGICCVLVLLTNATGGLSRRRKRSLSLLELSAMLLLLCDRFAYIYRGDVSVTGYWMVRVCNFMVYLCTLVILYALTLYMCDLYANEGRMEKLPRRLTICKAMFAAGVVLLIVSQFTGFYYTFDEQNRYLRAPGHIICYAIPLLIGVLLQTIILQYRKLLRRRVVVLLILNTAVPILASIIQIFTYGISLTNMSSVGMVIILYFYALSDLSESLRLAQAKEIETYKEAHQREHTLLEQTTEALASAIDAKDTYTNGHSRRVAEYAKEIAKRAGKPEEECEKIYFTALLHDVGKIGVPNEILSKKGRLTDEEFEHIKHHPVVGGQILHSIRQSPWLSIGARYHHERYNGRGYPEGLMGEQIPEIARIIAVADAYDAMTSNRSYRNAIPQHIVREELVEGIGTQFDPEFARIMIRIIDQDEEYRLQEAGTGANMEPTKSLRCDSMYHGCTEGVPITRKTTNIRLCSQPDDGYSESESLPTLIVFDSLDGRVHPGEENNRDLLYFEYARIRLDGRITERNTRKAEMLKLDQGSELERAGFGEPERGQRYKVTAARYRDHARIRVSDETQTFEVVLALPDATRFVYIALSGEHCYIHNIFSKSGGEEIGPGDIPRIAEEISFIRDFPEGDVPNLQVDSWRSDATAGIPIQHGMTLAFHTMSLPTARLVWHCPFISLFTSDDGRVNGGHFREYMLLRLYGENGGSDDHAENRMQVDQKASFEGWNVWKDENRKGLDCTVRIKRDGNVVTMKTENLGIAICSVTTIRDGVQDLYVALTGDQCAITNICVSRS